MDEKKIEKILFVMLVALSLCAWGMTILSLNQNDYETCKNDGIAVACIHF